MRVAYGAGAVAVASVMAVGLVQPDFTATADQQATDYPNVADPGSVQGQPDSNGRTQVNVQVTHVTKYIHLKPGQTAPPGAKVIQPGQPTPRIVVDRNAAPQAANHNAGGNSAAAAPKPPPAAPKPPTTRTHQSGHP